MKVSPVANNLTCTQKNVLLDLYLNLEFQLRQRLVYYQYVDYRDYKDKVVKEFDRLRKPLIEWKLH
jgi:hypothetical protein